MKKLLISASLVIASLAASAQDYKPVASDVTAELGLTGGLFNSDLNLNPLNQLRFRYFLADQMALRVGFNYSNNSNKQLVYEATPGSGEGSRVYKSSDFVFNVGVEKHLVGTDRLSTYVGADLLFVTSGASEKRENYTGGGAYGAGFNSTYKGYNTNGDNGSFGYGFRLIAGADYYFVEKVYLGGEFGWGFVASKNAKRSLETTPGTGGTTTTTETGSSGGSFNLSPQVTAGVRLGFRF